MQIIPVIDLMHGVVVRAKLGERATYQPIETPLSPSPDPVDVVTGLMRLAPFPTLYVADLDAILQRGDNFAVLDRLRRAFPDCELWIDNGAADEGRIAATQAFGAPVIGSESQRDLALLASKRDVLLSLDFRGDALQGPPELLARPDLWPARIIVMTLARIGGAAGPDFERLATIRRVAGPRDVYAAGGLRDRTDLEALQAAGVAGVLAASALHDGRITGADFAVGRDEGHLRGAVTKAQLSPS
jgi:phosphoribosylformimino-5-aminoimidazole carboxamide ribotide isomerase